MRTMQRTITTRLLCVLLAALLAAAAGCRSVSLPAGPVEDISPERRSRTEAAVEQFEARRNRLQFEAAQAAWDRGDPAACQESLAALLARAPSHRDARLLMASVAMEQNRPDEAMRQIESALADHPRDPVVHHAAGVFLEETGRADEALAYYQRAADLIATSTAPAAIDGVPAEGEESTDREDWAALADSARLAAAENLLRRGEAALAAGREDEAIAYLVDAVRQSPDDPHIPTTAAVSALGAGRPDLTISLAREALQRFPRAASLYRVLATAHYRRGEYQAAQLVLQQALSLDKSDALAYFLMGCTLAKLGQPAAADAHLREAARLDPRWAARAGAPVASVSR